MPRLIPIIAVTLGILAGVAQAQDSASRHLAPGFKSRPAQSRLVIVPADMELFSISAGGVQEPKADWTESAQRHFKAALDGNRKLLGPDTATLPDAVLDEFAELHSLHRAMAESVFIHHSNDNLKLPTKDDKLDWSLGADSVKPLKARTGADYALFTWIRDSYSSNERKAAVVAMSILSPANLLNLAGHQVGYASLVDLQTGRIVWFNDLQRRSGDLRDPQSASETVEALLKGFPVLK